MYIFGLSRRTDDTYGALPLVLAIVLPEVYEMEI
jgi:hypothetical protein